jgi:hypothetical protein
MQGSLPAGGLAFTGRELNPLDRYKRFQITHPPLLDLSWRKKGRPSCRVDEDVTTLAPHRSGRADFQHPVPHARASFHLV